MKNYPEEQQHYYAVINDKSDISWTKEARALTISSVTFSEQNTIVVDMLAEEGRVDLTAQGYIIGRMYTHGST